VLDTTTLAAKLEANSVSEPTTGCRLWLGGTTKAGYGRIGLGRRGVSRYAHRVAYELVYGPIPDGLCVCHHCDQPCCIEPSHLFAGTKADNSRDMVSKRRHLAAIRPWRCRGNPHPHRVDPADHPLGERCANSKLTADQVTEIRRRGATGGKARALAAEFGVSREVIYGIFNRKRWSWLE